VEANADSSVIHPTWIRTPLIDELLRKPGFNDIVLEPGTVADVIVEQVLRGESAQIILPGRLSVFLSTLRVLPSWFQELVRNSKGKTLSRL
jgi:all-trans-retinol dehydrogenase (NAD+)